MKDYIAYYMRFCIGVSIAAVLFSGCGSVPKDDFKNRSAGGASVVPVQEPVKDDAPADTVNPSVDPGQLRVFLDAEGIPHGDIYLQDRVLYINIVGL